MAISITRYVDITSGVGAGVSVSRRELILRLFTTSNLVPTDAVVTFESASDVGSYFGTTSEEYKRAVFYFGWVSKLITTPQKLSFASYRPAATAPRIYGVKGAQTLGDWTAISDGALDITLGSNAYTINGLDFSAQVSLSGVASVIQAGINAEAGTMWTSATVAWDSTNKRFNLVGGDTGEAAVGCAAPSTGGGTDISLLVGWRPSTLAIWSPGSDAEAPVDAVTASAEGNNNFGSFAFVPALSSIDDITDVAEWNQTQNVLFQFHVPVSAANASAWSAALIDTGGTGLTLSETEDEYPELLPCAILAATPYNRRNSTQNYMFQQADLTASVTTNTDAGTYDNLRVNYYGQTQTAGQRLAFYQRGALCGSGTDPVGMNVYANEQWLKDACTASLMELLLALTKVSANEEGRGQVLATLQSVINEALNNGVISIGKSLTSTQKAYVTQLTGDDMAWMQIQNEGYWIECVIESYVVDDRTEYKAVYTLIYSKDDAIRKVEGSNVLI